MYLGLGSGGGGADSAISLSVSWRLPDGCSPPASCLHGSGRHRGSKSVSGVAHADWRSAAEISSSENLRVRNASAASPLPANWNKSIKRLRLAEVDRRSYTITSSTFSADFRVFVSNPNSLCTNNRPKKIKQPLEISRKALCLQPSKQKQCWCPRPRLWKCPFVISPRAYEIFLEMSILKTHFQIFGEFIDSQEGCVIVRKQNQFCNVWQPVIYNWLDNLIIQPWLKSKCLQHANFQE